MNHRIYKAKPHRTWILLAYRSGARLYLGRGKDCQVTLVEKFDYPEGRRQTSGVDADVLAHRLALFLREGRTHQEFNDLVLVAEPGFLGKIGRFLDKETSRHLIGTLNQDWSDLPDREIYGKIRELVLEQNQKAA